jgi:hypothetical protein
MKIFKISQGTVLKNRLPVYLTISATSIAMLLTYTILALAMADESSLARKVEEQGRSGAATFIPNPEFSPDEVVRIQLDALANNNTPYQDAGIEIAFRFASPANKETTGPLSRFIKLVHNPIYNPMLNHETAQLGDLVLENLQAFLPVFLTASDGKRVGYMFILRKQEGSAFDQCWMTEAVLRIEVTTA